VRSACENSFFCRRPPFLDEIAKRFLSYIQRCDSCDFDVIKFVTSSGITVGHLASPNGSSALFCCSKFGFCTRDIFVLSPVIGVTRVGVTRGGN